MLKRFLNFPLIPSNLRKCTLTCRRDLHQGSPNNNSIGGGPTQKPAPGSGTESNASGRPTRRVETQDPSPPCSANQRGVTFSDSRKRRQDESFDQISNDNLDGFDRPCAGRWGFCPPRTESE